MATVGVVPDNPQIGVPAGGTAGQVLGKPGGVLGWTSPAVTAGWIYASGNWYNNHVGVGPGVSATFSINSVSTYYVPFYQSTSFVLGGLGTYVTTTVAGYNINFAIAQATAAGLPGTILASGTVATVATSGARTVAFAGSTVIPAGWAYIAIGVVGGTVGVNATAGINTRIPFAPTPNGPTNAAVGTMMRDTSSGTPVSNPSSLALYASNANVPVVWYQVA